MKLKTLVAATAAVIFAGNVAAQATSGSSLNSSGGGTYIGALPVGVVVNPMLRNALQALQLDSACYEQDTKACMPSISTIELASIIQGGFGQKWGNYGVEAFGTGTYSTAAVCGTIAGDEATRVAARHVGVGCSTANPETAFNGVGAAFNLAQLSIAACMGGIEGAGAGAIGFVSADTPDNSAYKFVKLDGQSPDLANFASGNFALFADLHGGSLTGTETTHPFGVTGAIAAAANPPMHAAAGNYTNSSECAPGRLRSGAAAGNLAD